MCLKGDDTLEASPLKAADNEPGVSLTLAKEASHLDEEPTLQEAQETTTHPPDHPEETLKPKVAARVTGPLDIQQQLPLLPLGFRLPILTSSPPPLEDVESLVYFPREV